MPTCRRAGRLPLVVEKLLALDASYSYPHSPHREIRSEPLAIGGSRWWLSGSSARPAQDDERGHGRGKDHQTQPPPNHGSVDVHARPLRDMASLTPSPALIRGCGRAGIAILLTVLI